MFSGRGGLILFGLQITFLSFNDLRGLMHPAVEEGPEKERRCFCIIISESGNLSFYCSKIGGVNAKLQQFVSLISILCEQ